MTHAPSWRLNRSRGAGQRTALAVLCTVLFITFLDNTVVSVALADIQSRLHVGVTGLQWVVNGYALVFAAFMLIGGTLGDLFGRKRVMLGGLGLFCVGSVVAAAAPNIGTLIAGRLIMGLGAAASEPGTLSVIRHVFPDHRTRAWALGVWAAVSGLALALGPVIGGVLVGLSSWRAVFWFNLAFGAMVLVAAALILPESADPQGRRLDAAGFVLGTAALAACSSAVIAGEDAGYGAWWVITLFVVAAFAAVAFVVVERRTADPMLPLDFFRQRQFTGANIVAFATYFAIFAVFFFVALYVQFVGQQSAYRLALDFGPMAVGMVLVSVLTGYWVARSGPRWPMTLGCLLAGAGLLLTDAVVSPDIPYLKLSAALTVAGIGFGMVVVPMTAAALSAIPAERSGLAASATNTSRELGAVFGVAVLGALVNARLTGDLAHKLRALGIPPQFQSIVIKAVTTGTAPKGAAATGGGQGGNTAGIIAQVIHAAESAFGSGLHIALVLAAILLFAGALVAFTTTPDASRNQPVAVL
jgi:EmrB/QacA subfamily drug resistance transporter